MASSMSPLLSPHTTLKDALSMLLGADVQAGIVVDHQGAVVGLLTVDMITARMQETRMAQEAQVARDGLAASAPTAEAGQPQ
jgi:CBS domain containing-hemolysin-like protein